MSKQTKYLVFAGLLAAVPLTALPGLAEGPAGECHSAPNRQSSAGGHWYYRLDRTNHRKCWYVGPAGKARSVTRKSGPHRVRVTHRTSRAVAEPAAAWDAEQPVLPTGAAVLVAENADGTGSAASQQIAQPKNRNVIISARWPDPVTANGSAPGARESTDIAGARAGSTAGSQRSVAVKGTDHSSALAALRAPEAAPEATAAPGPPTRRATTGATGACRANRTHRERRAKTRQNRELRERSARVVAAAARSLPPVEEAAAASSAEEEGAAGSPAWNRAMSLTAPAGAEAEAARVFPPARPASRK